MSGLWLGACMVLVLGAAAAEPAAAAPVLEWLADGRMLLEGRWLVRPDTGRAQPLLYPTVRVSPEGGYTTLPLEVSPSGQVLLLDEPGAGLFLGMLDGALSAHVPLPTLVAAPAASWHAAVWVDDRYLLLYQSSRETGEAVCALLDAQTRAWQPPLSTCPETDFAHVWRMIRGPGDWLVVESGGEGASGVVLQRWDPERGTRETVPLTVAPEARMAGSLEAFLVDGGFRLRAPCGLGGEGCSDDQDIWWLYDWLPSGDLRPLRSDLPVPAVPIPGSSELAWGEDGRVCIGNPTGERRCHPLPGD